MAAKNENIYKSAGNASISTKFSGMIPLVILSHLNCQKVGHMISGHLGFSLKMLFLATLKGCGLLLLHFLLLYVPLEPCMPLEHSFLPLERFIGQYLVVRKI